MRKPHLLDTLVIQASRYGRSTTIRDPRGGLHFVTCEGHNDIYRLHANVPPPMRPITRNVLRGHTK